MITRFICCKVYEMVAELRNMRTEVALYTDDNCVYEQFSKWANTKRKIPYTQDSKIIAVDLFFDKKLKNRIIRVLNGQLMLDM